MADIVPFQPAHLEDAARLVSRRYQDLRHQVPALPPCYEKETSLLPLLEGIVQAEGPGVAALQRGRLVGFLVGWLMPGFKGKRSVYSPEWANGAGHAYSRPVYEQMYRALSAGWVGEGYTTHYISLMPNDRAAVEGWHWLGFGMLGVDAVRGLQPVLVPPGKYDIRAAGPGDLEAVVALRKGLWRYALEPPYFFLSDEYDREFYEDWLAEPDKVVWLGFFEGEAVAFLQMGPANQDVAGIIVDEGTTSIYGAYTMETRRGHGTGAALLAHGIEAARQAGYVRCAVDFEAMNTRGRHFWFKQGFDAVSLTLMRRIDEGVA
jgi:GNAT superfamily N-acetyltransferase